MLPKWSSPFSAYYTDVIHPKIKHIGRWHLSRFGMDSITTNQSESFNAVIKHLQQWQEAPIDAMALSLFRLTQFYLVEVQRGRRGLGDYSLREGLVAESPFEQVPCCVTAPASIVDTIRNGASSISLISDQDSCLPSTSSATNIEQTMTVDVPDATSSLATTDTGEPVSPSTSCPTDIEPTSSIDSADHTTALLTTVERAHDVIQKGNISLNPQISVFTVLGTNEPRVVKLFPKTTCSCPSKSDCYHIRAAQLAVGLTEAKDAKRRINITSLRRNKRKRPDKTTGRKRPRQGDVDVVPADDMNADELRRLQDAVSCPRSPSLPPRSPSLPPRSPSPLQQRDIDVSICHQCDATDPPARKQRRRQPTAVNWVGCDACPRWYHTECVGMKTVPASYVCDMCQQ